MQSQIKISKAIILAGGYGTRRLPLTKAIDKCMLPIGNRPVIDYVVEDCVKAGITDIYIGLSQLGDQIRAYYGRNVDLEYYLQSRNKQDALAIAKELPKAKIHFFDGSVWPDEPGGTSMPVARFMQKSHVDDNESVLVLGGDDFIYQPDGSSSVRKLIDQTLASGATSGLVGVEIPHEKVNQFGVFDVASDGSFKTIVEKPSLEKAPSNLINVSKYLFDKELLEDVVWTMDNLNPLRHEAEITDALNRYAARGKKVHIAKVGGEYLDGGTVEGWLHANQRMIEVAK